MARQKHIHKYHLVAMKFRSLWCCGLPTCSHHMPPDLVETLPGKASICWECNEPFILDDVNMKDAQPRCANCNPTIKSMADALAKFGVK